MNQAPTAFLMRLLRPFRARNDMQGIFFTSRDDIRGIFYAPRNDILFFILLRISRLRSFSPIL